MKEQLTKFLIVGGFSTILNYAIFYGLYKLIGIYYLLSSAIGFLSGVVFGYFFNKTWTFQSKSKARMEIVKYYLVYIFSLFFSLVILRIEVEYFMINPLIANIITISITTIINFAGTKFFVFRAKGATLL